MVLGSKDSNIISFVNKYNATWGHSKDNNLCVAYDECNRLLSAMIFFLHIHFFHFPTMRWPTSPWASDGPVPHRLHDRDTHLLYDLYPPAFYSLLLYLVNYYNFPSTILLYFFLFLITLFLLKLLSLPFLLYYYIYNYLFPSYCIIFILLPFSSLLLYLLCWCCFPRVVILLFSFLFFSLLYY